MGGMHSSVSPKGQITIPVEIRRMLGIQPRDKVTFEVDDGQVRLMPERFTLESAFGSLEPPNGSEDFQEIASEAKEDQVIKAMSKLQDR